MDNDIEIIKPDYELGMKFDFYKNAESFFFKNGGTLTKEELKNLKFSNI